jgi:hypothetical protein
MPGMWFLLAQRYKHDMVIVTPQILIQNYKFIILEKYGYFLFILFLKAYITTW